METVLFLVIAIVALWRPVSYLYNMYSDGKYSKEKRLLTVAGLTIIFAIFGSSIGIVGFGGGIAGTIPGGLLGMYIGYRLGSRIFPKHIQRDPDAPVKAVSICPACNRKASVPLGKKLLVTCPHCSKRYEHGP